MDLCIRTVIQYAVDKILVVTEIGQVFCLKDFTDGVGPRGFIEARPETLFDVCHRVDAETVD